MKRIYVKPAQRVVKVRTERICVLSDLGSGEGNFDVKRQTMFEDDTKLKGRNLWDEEW